MTINAQTRIAALLKHKPEALEAIVGLSPGFVKLRNPVLRKLIAGRASIAMAAKMGGCQVEDFYKCLRPLGFDFDDTIPKPEPSGSKDEMPDFLKRLHPNDILELDVRPLIEKGEDPLQLIIQRIKQLQKGEVLRLVNSFEPLPLIYLLGKQGFEAYTETISDEKIYTWFYKKSDIPQPVGSDEYSSDDWTNQLQRFNGRTQKIDVRELEIPLPMMRILEKLDNVKAGEALFVFHKRIPIFLLPELKDRGFQFRARSISEGEVHLLIFKD